jgi:uncharacterized membrane protein YgdD (TMEM256/DUF423 family)
LTGERRIGWACLLGGVAVAMGAFGAHALRGQVSGDDLEIWKTGAQYLGLHAVALLALAGRAGRAWLLIFIGSVVFAGSLFALVLSGQRWWGAVTPVGGALLIAGWAASAWRFFALSRRTAKEA